MKKIEPAAWQFCQDGKWWNGDDRIKDHRKKTEAAEIPTRDLYTREALEAAVNAAVANCELVTGARFTVDTAAIINQLTGE